MTKFNLEYHIRRDHPCRKCGADHWLKSNVYACIPCQSRMVKTVRTEHKAKHDDTLTYEGTLCNECGTTLRYTGNTNCVECSKQYSKQYHKNNTERKKTYDAQYALTPEGKAIKAKAERDYRARKFNAPGSGFTQEEFEWVCNNYDNKCLACECTDCDLTADHVIPLSKGGPDNILNIQPLCGPCNSRKGANYVDYR